MAALPYMQLYISDYLADTAHLTTEEHGAYLLLIFHYWQSGKPLDNTNGRLANVARMSNRKWVKTSKVLAEFFQIEDNIWTHGRVEADLERVFSKSTKASYAGSESARQRSNKHLTNVERTLNERSTDGATNGQRSGNHTDTDTDKNTTTISPSDFDLFWTIYPKKIGKEAARKAFQKATVKVEAATIHDGVIRLASDPNLPELQYVPNPATWLNGGRWADEPYPPRKITPSEKADLPTKTPPPFDRREANALKAQAKPMPADFREALRR